jgi:hypothetical protein
LLLHALVQQAVRLLANEKFCSTDVVRSKNSAIVEGFAAENKRLTAAKTGC